MFAIAFDLSMEQARLYFPRSVSQPYTDIGATLRRYGFKWIQGSVYTCDREDLANLSPPP